MTPHATREHLRHRLLLAGNPRGIDVGRFLGIKVLGAIGVTALVVALAVLLRASIFAWILGIALSAFSYWLPDVWLSSAISRRQRRIRIALPDMLTISVEAGLGFDQAVAKIVRMSRGPLAEASVPRSRPRRHR